MGSLRRHCSGQYFSLLHLDSRPHEYQPNLCSLEFDLGASGEVHLPHCRFRTERLLPVSCSVQAHCQWIDQVQRAVPIECVYGGCLCFYGRIAPWYLSLPEAAEHSQQYRGRTWTTAERLVHEFDFFTVIFLGPPTLG